jgi:superoxide dismutase, Fe-Mn family
MKPSFFFQVLCSFGLCCQLVHGAESDKKTNEVQSLAANKYQVKNFDHIIGKIEGVDDSLLKMHFKLYEGYVNNTNLILDKLQLLATTGGNRTPEYAALKRILGWEFDGMLLHEYYFENLGGKKALDENDPLYRKMQEDFGGYDQWKLDFVSTGLIRGIGWVVAYV